MADKLNSKDSVIPCNCCGAVDQKAESHCTSCGGFICRDCVGIHSKVKNMSSHKLIPFKDLRSGKVDIRSISQQQLCKTHVGQVLWFYCETCGVLICRDCTVVDHPASSHVLLNLEKASEGQKTEIEGLIQDCSVVKKRMVDALKTAESTMANLEENAKLAQKKIDATFDEYKKNFDKMLEQKRKAEKSEVKQAVSQRKKQLEAETDDIQLQQTRINTALQMASEITQSGSNYDLAVAFLSVKGTLTQLRDMKPTRVQRHLGKIDFNPQQVGQPVMPSLGSLSFGKKPEGVWKLVKEFGNDGKGKLTQGRGIAVAPNGNIVVANNKEPKRVVVYSETGQFRYNVNTNLNLKTDETAWPWDVAVSSDGRIFVNQQTSQVHVYGHIGESLYQFPTISPDNISSDGQATCHMGIAIDKQGQLLVAETSTRYISRHLLDGTHIASFKVKAMVFFIACDSRKRIITSGSIGTNNKYAPCLHILDYNGQVLLDIKSYSGEYWNPYGVCCTEEDEFYVSSCNALMGIYKYSTNTGAYMGCVTKASNYPSGLALTDDGGRLIVVHNESVKIFRWQ